MPEDDPPLTAYDDEPLPPQRKIPGLTIVDPPGGRKWPVYERSDRRRKCQLMTDRNVAGRELAVARTSEGEDRNETLAKPPSNLLPKS